MKAIIRTEQAPAAIGPYSQAVRVGNLLFASGQIPLRPDGTLREGDIKAQTEQVMENVTAVLTAAGLGLEQVVKATCYLKDLSHFAAFNEVYGRYFANNPPARSTVEVARLPKDVLVEVEIIAVAP
ncbi:MAG: RidA family protein [Truepera sp.]|nr:RidA family protein [Truepera sp.]